MKSKLTFLLALTFLFLFSCSVYGDDLQDAKDDMWIAEQMESGGAVAYVNGQITYGDKHRIWIGDSKCNGGEQIFSFYTTKNNKDILNLKGKVVEIKYNQEIIRAKIITTEKFIMGHSAMFTLGGYSIAQLIKIHEDLPYISIELIDSENFTASDYFDVLENKWSLKSFEPALIEAKSICENLKISSKDVVSESKESNKTTSSQGIQQGLKAYRNKDYKKALEILKPLAEQGNAKAQFKLGRIYYEGYGVSIDKKESVKWTRLAAEQGVADAQSTLGAMYHHGDRVSQNLKKSLKWYRLAAEQGDVKAQEKVDLLSDIGGILDTYVSLGDFEYQKEEVPKNYKFILKYYRLAAEQGHHEAQNNLGSMYSKGQGVPQDYKEAIKWWRLAVEQGDAEAQCNLGVMYYEGIGVPQDYEEAVKWWRLAAEQRHERAQFNLEMMHGNSPN